MALIDLDLVEVDRNPCFEDLRRLVRSAPFEDDFLQRHGSYFDVT